MKAACQHKIVVDAELVQAFVEVPLIYEATSSVNDDESIHHPRK
jgi:hypothetical protein